MGCQSVDRGVGGRSYAARTVGRSDLVTVIVFLSGSLTQIVDNQCTIQGARTPMNGPIRFGLSRCGPVGQGTELCVGRGDWQREVRASRQMLTRADYAWPELQQTREWCWCWQLAKASRWRGQGKFAG